MNPYGQATPAVDVPAAPASTGRWVPPHQRTGQERSHAAAAAVQPIDPRAVAGASAPIVVRPKTPLKFVKVDALVLMRIVKHCRDHSGMNVNGHLLGLDSGGVLEVTNCHPLKAKGHTNENPLVDEEQDLAFVDMMRQLRADCFTAGWYQTMHFEDLKDKDILDSLCTYKEDNQPTISHNVVIGFDPLLNSMGRNAFRVYRLSDDFMRILDTQDPRRLKTKDALVEVPLVVDNPALIDAFLIESEAAGRAAHDGDLSALQLDQAKYMERCMGFVSSALHQLISDHNQNNKSQSDRRQKLEALRQENDQRRLRGEPPAPLPPDIERRDASAAVERQLKTVLLSDRVASITSEVANTATEDLMKTYLIQERRVGGH
eukprot:Selendium_serpulae@DN5110_c0_g1_i1.p1